MIKNRPDPLLQLTENLEQALAASWQGRERPWIDELRQALTRLDGALFRHRTSSEGKLLAPVEMPFQERSPGLSREVQTLREDHGHMAEKVNALLAKLGAACATAQELEDMRRLGNDLALALHAFRDAENKLVLETALRDTGAGD